MWYLTKILNLINITMHTELHPQNSQQAKVLVPAEQETDGTAAP